MKGSDILKALTEADRSQRDLARHLGLEPPTVNKMIKGKRRITSDEADQIRIFFGLTDRIESKSGRESDRLLSKSLHTSIPEVDMRAGGASGGDLRVWQGGTGDEADVTVNWLVPSSWAESIPAPEGRDLYIFQVVGNSMAPDFPAGCRVLVNAADRQPSPPGPFVVFDGLSFVIKLVSHEPFSDPAQVILSSRDPIYPTYTRTTDEAYIQGRVVGKWEWT